MSPFMLTLREGVVFFSLRRYIFSSPIFSTRPQSAGSSAPGPKPIVVNPASQTTLSKESSRE